MTNIEFKGIRKTLGLTQPQLAVSLGCNPNTISRMETGDLPIVDAKAKAIMSLLKLAALMLLFLPSLVWAGDFYGVRFADCYDGDTCTFLIPWLPHPFSTVKIRAVDVDTPEKSWRAKCPQERELATKAAEATNTLMREATTIDLLDLGPPGIYGRNPATVVIDKTVVWSVWLIESGYAVPSEGKRTEDWCRSYQ